MSGIKTSPALLSKAYRRKVTELTRLSKSASSRLSPDTVHDLRVTSRKLQVMLRLTPRTARSSEDLKKLDAALRGLLKDTSSVRDADTLLLTLQPFGAHLSRELADLLQTGREKAAVAAQSSIRGFTDSGLSFSALHGYIKGSQKRLKRRINKRGRSVGKLLGVVLKDESKVVELHALRKEVKKLRYLLELTDGTSDELSILTRWQDTLGKVHDTDVAIAFTTDHSAKFKDGEVVLEALKKERHASYLEFRRECRKLDSETMEEILNRN